MTTGTVPQDVKAYLSAVRARLDDPPAEESDAPVEQRLGLPHTFADELRAAAGLSPRAETADDAPRRGLKAILAAAGAFFATSPTTRWLRDLAPLWWGDIALNAFPILYFEPGTRRVADPTAGVPARPGPLATKPPGAR